MDINLKDDNSYLKIKKRNAIDKIIKRFFDFFLSFLALICLSPLLLTVALLIKLDGGPIFYAQERVGLNQKIFKMYKFRSMIVNADSYIKNMSDKEAAEFLNNKEKKDKRVTKIGRFIRRFSIDELPQLFNILNGSMTIVGPRPINLKEANNLSELQKNRFKVKQGLTCYWQIYRKNDMTIEERVQLDLKYVSHANIFVDIKIILLTIPVVLFGGNK